MIVRSMVEWNLRFLPIVSPKNANLGNENSNYKKLQNATNRWILVEFTPMKSECQSETNYESN